MGHETNLQKQKLAELEKFIDFKLSPIEHLLELAKIYIEPFHQEDKAIEVLKITLAREPGNSIAKLLLAYCYIHYSMDNMSLKEAENMLRSVIQKNDNYKGGALMLLAEVLDDLGEITNEEIIELLELSIKYEPSWVFNHHRLAWAYKKQGNKSKAVQLLEVAINNISKDIHGVKDFIEDNIAGKFYSREYFEEDLEKIIRQ